MADKIPEPTPEPAPDAPPAPPSSGPAPTPDEATIGNLIEAKIKALFAERDKSTPPPAPAGDPVDVEGMINAAIAKALQERDKEDQVFVLQQEIDSLKEQFKGGTPERKRGWGSYILGPGLIR